jgi:hypothetical protein
MCSRRLTNPSMGSLPGSLIQTETRSSYGSRFAIVSIFHGRTPISPPGQEGWREAPGWLFKRSSGTTGQALLRAQDFQRVEP